MIQEIEEGAALMIFTRTIAARDEDDGDLDVD
jgi:hypothetical protein